MAKNKQVGGLTDNEIDVKLGSVQPSPNFSEYRIRMVRAIEPLIRFKEMKRLESLGFKSAEQVAGITESAKCIGIEPCAELTIIKEQIQKAERERIIGLIRPFARLPSDISGVTPIDIPTALWESLKAGAGGEKK